MQMSLTLQFSNSGTETFRTTPDVQHTVSHGWIADGIRIASEFRVVSQPGRQIGLVQSFMHYESPCDGDSISQELWLFACEDGGGRHLPLAEEKVDVLVDLYDQVWAINRNLLTVAFGLVPESSAVRTTPRRDVDWRLVVPNDTWAWQERGRLR